MLSPSSPKTRKPDTTTTRFERMLPRARARAHTIPVRRAPLSAVPARHSSPSHAGDHPLTAATDSSAIWRRLVGRGTGTRRQRERRCRDDGGLRVAGWCCGLPCCHESVGDDGARRSHCELDTAERASPIGFRRRRSCSGARTHACTPPMLAGGRPYGGTRWAVLMMHGLGCPCVHCCRAP